MFEHKAKEFMTHRSEIVALDGSIPLLEAVDKILSSGHRSYPVYEENLDTIHGIVSITDAMREYVYHKERRNLPLAEIPGLLTEVFMVPETSTLSGILKDGGPESHLIIVVDEYGQTSGLISMADLFDEFAGEFVAEYDTDDSPVYIRANGSIIMDGLIPLVRAGEVLGYEFEDAPYETLNGYLTSLLRHIPTDADKSVTGKEYLFHILKTEHHVIRKVRAVRIRKEV